MKKEEFSFIAGDYKNDTATLKERWAVFHEINILLLHDLAFNFFGIYLREGKVMFTQNPANNCL